MIKYKKEDLEFRLKCLINNFNEFKQELFMCISGFEPFTISSEEELLSRIKELSELLETKIEVYTEEEFEEQGKFKRFKLKVKIKENGI